MSYDSHVRNNGGESPEFLISQYTEHMQKLYELGVLFSWLNINLSARQQVGYSALSFKSVMDSMM